MADSPANMNPNADKGMEKRLLLAFALMMIVLLGAQYFFKPVPAPKPIAPSRTTEIAHSPAPAAAAHVEAAPAVQTEEADVPVQAAAAESTQVIDTTVYHIVFSNKGGVVKSWLLKRFHDISGKKQLDLVNDFSSGLPLPFSIDTQGKQLPFDPNQVLYTVKRDPDGLGLTFELRRFVR
jgi:YidC/Oxa1 family membrane protein insertase